MNSQNGYYDQWPPGHPFGDRRFLPVAGGFGNVPPPNLSRPQPHNVQQYPIQFPHGQFLPPQQAYLHPQTQFTPLIPLSAVEDLQLPQIPFTTAGLPDSFVRAPFATSGPVVHEGYIPAPGRNEEDDYPDLPPGYRDQFHRDSNFDSSDDESSYEDELTFEEQMRVLEERDNSDVDKDYSEEDAQQDGSDLDDMELDEGFEDEEERSRSKQGKPSTGGKLTARDGVIKVPRGGRRGRPSTRGRGGHSASASTRGRKPRGPGRQKGRRGPRAVADPGQEFKDLQRQANERFIARDYQAALDYASKAIRLNPEIFDAHNTASEIYAAMDEEIKSIDALIIGAPTKRDPGLWHFIIERVNKLDEEKHPEYKEATKTALTLECLKQIILLDKENYEARSHLLEIEARLGHPSKCIKLGRFMLKLRRDKGKAPDTEVLKIMAMMGTSSAKQTRLHLEKLLDSFDEAMEIFTKMKPDNSDLDWELINIYLDLLDKSGQYDLALLRLRALSRWKQGRSKDTYWDEQEDDREFDIEDEPRRAAVPQFKCKSQNAMFGQTLPLEIRVKLGIFRLRKGANDFSEAMHHLEMLQPDDHSPGALVWDYEDLFRVIADALHATGHDREALRFYEPIYHNNSPELGLMSYIGIHTCYKNLGEDEKAEPIIPILKEWNAETVDDLVVLAIFFENQGMLAEAIQRAQIVFRNKYGHRLRKRGFKAYDDFQDLRGHLRKQALGNHSARKAAAAKHRKLTEKATGRGADDSDSAHDGADKKLPSLGPLAERPIQGLFRTKRLVPKPPKAQTFLPFQADTEAEPAAPPRPTTLEGTSVPLQAIDHRFFRRRLEGLARDCAEELQVARAQHREITASFKRLDEITDAAEDGDEDAINEILSITRELIEEFSTFDLFYSNRKEELQSYFRRVGKNEEIWKESALMMLAVVANNTEDGVEVPELKEKPEEAPQDFWGVHFNRWVDAFGRYAIILARDGDDERCFSTIDIAIQSNIVYRSKAYFHQLQLCRLVCALAVDNSNEASSAVRWLLKENPFGTDLFRLFSCVNRLCAIPEGYSTGPTHKILMRYIKTMDFALLTEEERVWYNFRDTKDKAGGFQNSVNVEDVKFVKDHDPALFALYAHVLMCGGSYMAALNYYFRAFAITPDDPILNLSIGVAYIQHAMKRLSENRQYQIQQGLAFINRYYELRIQDNIAIHVQEAEFNMARVWHGLGLVSHAIPAYERCIGMSGRVKREAEDRCSDGSWAHEDFKYEAAFAIQNIYAVSGNFEGAKAVTENVLVIE